jgi:UDP-glucose 4-epimerase
LRCHHALCRPRLRGRNQSESQKIFSQQRNCGTRTPQRSDGFAGAQVHLSSTAAVYGTPDKSPITEDTPRQPVNPYGATKLALENALEAYSRAYGLRYVAFRYFNAAGADDTGKIGENHDPETHLIPLILQAIQGKRAALEIFGDDYPTVDGTCIRDYIHVNDLAEAHVLGLEYLSKGESCAMNLGTGKGYSVPE